jgi:hypothetical protein
MGWHSKPEDLGDRPQQTRVRPTGRHS